MVKVRKNFRFDSETLEMMDTLVVFLSSEKHIKLSHTTLIEMLVSERYEKLIKGDEE